MGLPILFARKKKFNPRQLFAAGEQGVWYDPSDWTTLFQDSAGTTPVTAIEQPVGLILDKSGRGNHASQPTTTSRPILRNRYNLLTYTEQFDNGAWSKDVSGTAVLNVSTNSTTAPDGTATADTVTEVNNTNFHRISQSPGTLAPATVTFSVYVKNASGNRYVGLSPIGSTTAGHNAIAVFDLQNKTYLGAQTAGATLVGTIVNPIIADVGNGWLRLSATGTSTTLAAVFPAIFLLNTFVNNGTSQGSYAGDGTSGIYIWGASFVVANDGNVPYQWVTTGGAAGYDTDVTKFPPYLFFDGSDDWLNTANVDFSATDEMSVFAGVRKFNTTSSVLVELSADIAANNGVFVMNSPASSGYTRFASKGTISQFIDGVDTSPSTGVITGLGDISGDRITLRINGTQVAQSTTDQGTGNYGNYPLYIGRRGGTTLPFSGRIYSLLIRGTLTSSPQLEQTERWVAGKTGVTL